MAIDNAHAKDDEKSRADKQAQRAAGLQGSLDILQGKSDENRKFFDLVRQLIAAQTEQERVVLREQLRGFVFTTTTTTTTTIAAPKSSNLTTTSTTLKTTSNTQSSTTSTTAKTTSTTQPTTSTTEKPKSPSSTLLQICITNPIKNVCS